MHKHILVIPSHMANVWPISINGLSSGLRAPSAHNAATSKIDIIKTKQKTLSESKI